MRSSWWPGFLIGVIGVQIGGWLLASGNIEVGQPFPELVLPRLGGGSPASIAEFRGRRLMLHVFASW